MAVNAAAQADIEGPFVSAIHDEKTHGVLEAAMHYYPYLFIPNGPSPTFCFKPGPEDREGNFRIAVLANAQGSRPDPRDPRVMTVVRLYKRKWNERLMYLTVYLGDDRFVVEVSKLKAGLQAVPSGSHQTRSVEAGQEVQPRTRALPATYGSEGPDMPSMPIIPPRDSESLFLAPSPSQPPMDAIARGLQAPTYPIAKATQAGLQVALVAQMVSAKDFSEYPVPSMLSHELDGVNASRSRAKLLLQDGGLIDSKAVPQNFVNPIISTASVKDLVGQLENLGSRVEDQEVAQQSKRSKRTPSNKTPTEKVRALRGYLRQDYQKSFPIKTANTPSPSVGLGQRGSLRRRMSTPNESSTLVQDVSQKSSRRSADQRRLSMNEGSEQVRAHKRVVDPPQETTTRERGRIHLTMEREETLSQLETIQKLSARTQQAGPDVTELCEVIDLTGADREPKSIDKHLASSGKSVVKRLTKRPLTVATEPTPVNGNATSRVERILTNGESAARSRHNDGEQNRPTSVTAMRSKQSRYGPRGEGAI
ncbi:MAG: hypothetical protein L6R38_005150 [Xanthoria sp. 2 TBL-2021]|nr:MAG: hypothetical protein L6R38_005143 [Xanthoria sp. 2 TBL-2021]KAI4278909.1 MAG: hypothetical protein L6R38_005150 [Xanthoria sp. 2 TBL-2021]